ncbi:MAG: amidohydrolase [Dehalococcoidia bacterium]|jgi:hypothetical protein|nr:amidohydrolase [Dehalococcoidia bacterium]
MVTRRSRIFRNAGGIITMVGDVAPTLDTKSRAIWTEDGRIRALGGEDEIRRASPTGAEMVDLAGAVVMPGLIDSHAHLLQTGLGWSRVSLADARSIDDIVQAIAERVRATPDGDWIQCSSRWHETRLREGRLPTVEELDRAAPRHPVYLPRGGHVVVTNHIGLELAGITASDTDPEGGQFVRDGERKLTGMLLEAPAFRRLTRLLPQATEEDRQAALQEAGTAFSRSGITSVREPGLDVAGVKAYQTAVDRDHPIRTSLMWRVDLGQTDDERTEWLEQLGPAPGVQNDGWPEVWGLKITLDGGVEGGYFKEGYANDPQQHGFPLTSQESLNKFVQRAHTFGWRIGIHVVGDAAMDMALIAFEGAGPTEQVVRRGHVLEHAFVPPPGGIERTRRLGLGVTLQHALVYSLGGNMRTYWGEERAANCTPTREWVDSGVAVGAGTDTPVTDFDPWLNIFGFMTRETDVAGVLGPEHRITAAEALRMYTTGSAKILGAGNVVGSLEPGKLADFICLDRDPLSAAPDEVRATRVLRTVVGGRAVHSIG